ncbi:hypothetical protein P4637_03215 [Halalkalibacterium halodurans]|uniref:hypothetical protein n=1 Tax=Halalkalibacterium halodurans TaxID=86665 RepID=UPI002E1A8848|nr:hypothetical protein [Halalkalibacterium halodurans]MED4105510.1 hypothetical protein [Halalkalibacterium halodurans]MED4109284.1 hypothetical protein [Halalkalibacterium halodurans]MED4149702.1 hypothetical protein [Halalkalibacterium halodurans]
MRFNQRITFVTEHNGGYNPGTGEHDEPSKEAETVACNLSELGIERTNELFGQIDKKIIVARLQRPYAKPFDYAEINGDKYNVKRQSDYRKGAFYLEGSS